MVGVGMVYPTAAWGANGLKEGGAPMTGDQHSCTHSHHHRHLLRSCRGAGRVLKAPLLSSVGLLGVHCSAHFMRSRGD